VTVPHAGAEPPTALSWLRRRGPEVPEPLIHRLFRDEAVRVWDPETAQVRRVGKASALPPGARLLLPKTFSERPSSSPGARGEHDHRSRADAGGARVPAARQHFAAERDAAAAAGAVAALRRSLLLNSPDFLAISKPGGLAVQGGSGVRVSVDDLMHDAFRREAGPGQLRLVHRLDKDASGALLLAKSADAAAWLGAAFQGAAARLARRDDAPEQPRPRRGKEGQAAAPAGPHVLKTYWAVLCRGGRGGTMRRSGTLTAPVGADADGQGSQQAAETQYKVLAEQGPLVWMQLRPSTGRKHQLRVHCARSLGAPILGDSRYGAVRSREQREALEQLRRALREGPGAPPPPPPLLHCRSLEVRRPGAPSVRVLAPLPPAWVALFAQQGWKLPTDSQHRVSGRRQRPSLKRAVP
jgi:23S rRNA-/tRNA-specific pseudouridylate synthase